MWRLRITKRLYRIEKELRETRESTPPTLWHQQRLERRQQESRPIFVELIALGG